MNEFVTYEADLQWMKLLEMTPEVKDRIVDDINSFHPHVPIETIYSDVSFRVVLDEEGKLLINVNLSFDKTVISGDEPFETYSNILDEVVVCRIKDLLFAMNLAYPGHISIFRSLVFRDGEPIQVLSYSADISGMAYTDCKWIPFESLTINQCWDWITTKTSFLSFYSRSPIDRALHALSYESVANGDTFVFFVLLGIEAIYNNGNNREDSITAQLKRKIQAILGELPPKAIKEINTMYIQRSKLVHGGANIVKCWPSEDYSDEEEEKYNRENDYMITATGILIATIQKFIKANANVLVENVTVSLESMA